MRKSATRRWMPVPAVFLLLGVMAFPASAGIDAGPCLQNITSDSAELLYEGAIADGTGLVEYGLTPAYGDSVVAGKRGINSEWYLAGLTGLVPSSQYFYRLTHEGIQKEGSFFTPPAPGEPFTFAVIGDTRTNHVAHQSVVDGVVADGYPDLLFNTGDLVESGVDKALWQTFFSIEGDLLGHTIFGPVFGNHEAGPGTLYGWYFHSGDQGKFWYSFSYGNAFFVLLNTEALTTGEQKTFLENELIQARSNPDIDFIFAIFHKPGVTTSSGHAPDNGVLVNLLDLLETYNVDAVFNGHNHQYEHGIVNGIHHIVSGGGGAPQYGFIDPYTPQGWTIVHREATYQYCYVTVNGSSYTMEAKYPDGTVFDSYTATTADGGFAGPTPQDLLDRSVTPCGGCASRYNESVPDVDASTVSTGAKSRPGSAVVLVFNAGLYAFPALFIAGLRRKIRKR
jgi:acid phosphatase type 7